MDNIEREKSSEAHFVRRTLIVTAVAVLTILLLYLLWRALPIALVFFAGLLFAVFLQSIASWLERHTPLPYKGGLLLTGILLLGLLLLGGWSLAPQLAEQAGQLQEDLTQAVVRLRAGLSGNELYQQLMEQFRDVSPTASGFSQIWGGLRGIFSTGMDYLVYLVIILFTGLYLAGDPPLYVNGLIKLVPRARRGRASEVLGVIIHSLRWWLAGQFAAMLVIGVLSIVGLTLIGIPLALILGVLAGLLAFIPLLGPTLALIPPLLIALTISSQHALYVLLLYLGIQFAESYIITPVIQRRATNLPPVLLVLSQVVLGLLGGVLGVALAAPLIVVVIVVVKMLYVEDVLGDYSVSFVKDTEEAGQAVQAVRDDEPAGAGQLRPREEAPG